MNFKINDYFLSRRMRLTLTRVVFEYPYLFGKGDWQDRLTLTRVVFELSVIEQIPTVSYKINLNKSCI